jgi:uncharacterized membrane protein
MEVLESRRLCSRSWSIIDVSPLDVGANVYAVGPGNILVGHNGAPSATAWRVGHDGSLSSQWLMDPGASSLLKDINSSGSLVGMSFPRTTDKPTSGTLWKPAKDGGYVRIDLGALTGPAEIFSDANRIADNGLIAGTASIPNTAQHPAVAWLKRDGSVAMVDLIATRPDKKSEFSFANDVSSGGFIVGYRGSRAVVWALGRNDRVDETFLDTLGGATNNALAVSSSGKVVGVSATSLKLSGIGPAAYMGFVSSRIGNVWSVTSLGTLPHEEVSSAADINDSGVIVGGAGHSAIDSRGKVSGGGRRAVLWQLNHGKYSIVPLDTLIPRHSGWTSLTEARRINNDGTILGQGWKNGEEHTFLLVPPRVPPRSTSSSVTETQVTASPASAAIPNPGPVNAAVISTTPKVENALFEDETDLF